VLQQLNGQVQSLLQQTQVLEQTKLQTELALQQSSTRELNLQNQLQAEQTQANMKIGTLMENH
jgi:hypothetical protein